MQTVRRFLEMIRFSHTLFALPFALFSAILAWYLKQAFSWTELIGILLCMVFARSAGMAFNRLADRDIDALNPRTAVRHLPSGQLSVGSVWLFTLLCCAGFIGSTALFLLEENPSPIYLSVPVLLFVLVYSWTKDLRWAIWLSASLLLPVHGSRFAASRGLADSAYNRVSRAFWVAGFDIIYACQDADFDRRAKLRSIPAAVGFRVARWRSRVMR